MNAESLNSTSGKPVLTECQQFWLDHIKTCDAAGSTAKQYAKEHDLSLAALYQHKKELRKRGLLPAPSRKTPSFAKVRMASSKTPEAVLRICFPNGICVEWSTSSQAAEVKQLLQMVANLS